MPKIKIIEPTQLEIIVKTNQLLILMLDILLGYLQANEIKKPQELLTIAKTALLCRENYIDLTPISKSSESFQETMEMLDQIAAF